MIKEQDSLRALLARRKESNALRRDSAPRSNIDRRDILDIIDRVLIRKLHRECKAKQCPLFVLILYKRVILIDENLPTKRKFGKPVMPSARNWPA